MKEYHRAIIFTKIPLGGYYRYKDVFQLFPAQLKDMPYSLSQRHYPNILEYWTTEEEKIIVDTEYENLKELYSLTATTLTKQDKILSLLTSFTNNIFFRYSDSSGNWGIPVLNDNPGEEANSWSSKWCMSMFHYPELPQQLSIKEFTKPETEEVKKIPHSLFYILYPSLDNDREAKIIFPDSIEEILDSYFSLDSITTSIVDSAIGHNVSAIELLETKRTLSLLASFTSMETMVELENKNGESVKCEKCGQLKFSVRRKFREYLLKYIGSSDENKRKFNSYYELRSKTVHTGRRLKTELLFSDVNAEEKKEEYITRIEILQIGKMSIVNWLLKNNNPL